MSDLIQSTTAHAPVGGHLWHLLFLAAWFPVFAFIVLFEKLTTRRRARRLKVDDHQVLGGHRESVKDEEMKPNGSVWLQATALASLSAALVHAAVMPDHFKESAIYGAFFMGAFVGQLGFGVLILAKPSRRLVTAGIIGSGLMIVLWLISRHSGCANWSRQWGHRVIRSPRCTGLLLRRGDSDRRRPRASQLEPDAGMALVKVDANDPCCSTNLHYGHSCSQRAQLALMTDPRLIRCDVTRTV